MKQTRSLANRLTTAFSLTVIIPLVVASLIFGWGFINFNNQTVQTRQKNVIDIGQAYVNQYFDHLIEELNLIGGLTNKTSPDWITAAQVLCQKSNRNYLSLSILDKDGDQIAFFENCQAVQEDVQVNRSSEEAFFRAARGELFIGDISFNQDNQPVATISFLTNGQNPQDIIVIGRVDLGNLAEPLNNLEIGESGYIYIVDGRGNLVGYRDPEVIRRAQNLASLPSVAPLLVDQAGPSAITYKGLTGENVVGTSTKIENIGWGLVLEQPTSEVLEARNQLGFSLLIVLVIFGTIAVLVSLPIARSIVTPIQNLAKSAEAVAQGDFSVEVEIKEKDEIGLTASAFNQMTSRLREFIGTLEQRVADRTRALAISGQISRRLSTITEQSTLITAVVEELKSGFNYYHAHIYLINESGDYLDMAGGTGEAGEILLERGHRLPVGRGLVGRAAENKEIILVEETRKDSDWLPNPLLPDTQAEIAVPIMSGEQILGVLDIQNDTPNSLSEQDAELIRTIADQFAIALQNIRQAESTQKIANDLNVVANVSLATATSTDIDSLLQQVVDLSKESFRLYHAHIYLLNEAKDTLVLTAGAGEVGRTMVAEKRAIALDSEKSLVARAARDKQGVIVNNVQNEPDFLPNPLLPETRAEMAVPMMVAGEVVGVLDVQSETVGRFTEVDINIKTTLASQVAVALQNARSLIQARNQAERETAINTISQKIQSATSMQDALKITARELGHVLGKKSTYVYLKSSDLAGKEKGIK